ncbi:hypothetical protein, partial [Aeromonas media]|uniref:hypothetical protein n=1 Tax=Aeromonas media TaxID=651 RepID=UPI001C569771
PGWGKSHEQGHRAWYAHSAGRQLSPPGGLGSEYPTLDLINKATAKSQSLVSTDKGSYSTATKD